MNPQQQQQQQQHHDDYDVDDDAHNHPSYCPSFRTYSTIPATHDIASRLVSHDDDFEFTALVTGLPASSPVYPVFNRDLIRDHGSPVQLGKLFSDEDDEVHLKGASPETYCLWAPKSPEMASPGRCMKSSSTGSSSSSSSKAVSKTWKLRNLLRRCKSDGKEGLMLVTDTPPRKTAKSPASPQWGGGSGGGREVAATTAAAGRRKSYLPYKQDLLGFFGSPQALRKINIPPF